MPFDATNDPNNTPQHHHHFDREHLMNDANGFIKVMMLVRNAEYLWRIAAPHARRFLANLKEEARAGRR